MRYLRTDEQTLNDLGIFDKPGKASIYDLYNKTVTHGGSLRLAQLFREPLADADLINSRASVYRFFSEGEYRFPVDPETMGAVAYYLENEDVRSQLQVGGQSLSQRVKNMVAADADYVFVRDGVQAALRLFYQAGGFVKALEGPVKESAYVAHYQALAALLTSPSFRGLREHVSSRHEAKLEGVVLSELDKQIRFEHREQLQQLLSLLYELDVCIAVGQVARKRGFHFARALPKDSLSLHFQQVYHPYVEKAIANDLHLSAGHNILFLTGANMAGKSTLMKAIGIGLYLGHMGFPVAAEKLEFAVRDGIFSNINLADNLNAGASHYYAEVLRVKEVAQALSEGRELFVIFDELFRGTNVKDAYDATLALTRAFTAKKGSQFIISTHIMEAGEVLSQEPLSIQYRYLPTEMQGNMPVYTRILKEGITDDRQGMIIIQNEGILELLDKGARQSEASAINETAAIETNIKKEAQCHS